MHHDFALLAAAALVASGFTNDKSKYVTYIFGYCVFLIAFALNATK